MVRIPEDVLDWCSRRGMKTTADRDDRWEVRGKGLLISHGGENYEIHLRNPDSETFTIIRTPEIQVFGNTLNLHKPHTEAAVKDTQPIAYGKEETIERLEKFIEEVRDEE